jgi:Ca-activated chloride channel family protein
VAAYSGTAADGDRIIYEQQEKNISMKVLFIKFLSQKTLLIFSAALLFGFYSKGQNADQLIANGNAAYAQKNYAVAETYYRQAIGKDVKHQWPEAAFNLGNALYAQKKYTDAITQFKVLVTDGQTAEIRQYSLYNLGTIYLEQQLYPEAVAAFRQTLKLNPRDEDARYNLAYAMKHTTGTTTATTSQREEPAPPENAPPPLSPDELKRLQNELKESENKTLNNLFKKSKVKQSEKDW